MALHFRLYYDSPQNGEHLRQVIDSSGAGLLVEANDLAHLPGANKNGTDVVMLEYQDNNPQLDQWIEATAADPKNPAVFLVFPEISANQLWKALHLGVKECFAFPVQPQEFQDAVNRLLLRSTAIKAPAGNTPKIITFLGSKGGIGATFIAANLAYLLSREHQGQVLLIDLDLQYGQLLHSFNAKTQHSLSEVIAHLDQLDHAYLQTLLFTYNKFLSLLPAPSHLEEAEAVTAEHLGKILTYLKNMQTFRWLLVDAGHRMDELTLKVLEHSDHLVLLTSPLVPALANTKKWLGLLQILELNPPLEIWLNPWNKDADLTPAEIATYLGMEVRGTIPFDLQAVNRSINDGRPLAEISPRHPVCQALRSMAVGIVGQEAMTEAPASGWSWLKRLGGKN